METGRGRANAQASFTARATTRAVAKAEVSDPTVLPRLYGGVEVGRRKLIG